ncbi:hypothetical protein IAT38_005421 [Cryptococcus sp. DSM 104549]
MAPHTPLRGFMPLLLLALMWSHFPGFAHAQSAAATSTAAASAAATSTTAAAAVSTTPAATSTAVASTTAAATTTYTGKPYLVIHNVETMTACGLGQIYWNVYNEDDSKVNITVYAINEGVDQTVPSASTTAVAVATSAASSAAASPAAATSAAATSAAATSAAAAATSAAATSAAAAAAASARSLSSRSLLSINASIITQYANHGYGWDPVLLPAGRYYIWGYVDDGFGTSNRSNVFTVVEGSNTSCLAAFASQSKTASLATGSVAGTSKIASASSSAAAGGASSNTGESEKNSGLSGGAIAGVVIGVLAGVAALAILALVCLRRRRRQRGYSSENPPPMGMTHRRMLSGSTAPSDPGHGTTSSHGTAGAGGKGQIPMGTIRRGESWNSSIAKPRGSSTDSFGHNADATPVVLGASGGSRSGEKEDGQEVLRSDVRGEDPFLTPTMPPPSETSGLDQPQRASGYSDYPLYASFDRRASNPMPPPPPPAAITSSTSTDRSRSSSHGDPRGERPARRTPPGSVGASPNPGGSGGAQVGRTPSTRRKPVPSLGPELRGQLEKQSSAGRVVPAMPASESAGAGTGAGAGLGLGIPSDAGGNGERRKSYQLMPDLPLPQD